MNRAFLKLLFLAVFLICPVAASAVPLHPSLRGRAVRDGSLVTPPSDPLCVRFPGSLRTRSGGKQSFRVAFVPAQFQDLSFSFSSSVLTDLVCQEGFSQFGACGSVYDYFKDQIGEWYDISFGVSPIVTLPQGFKYYGGDNGSGEDIRPEDAVRRACELADPSFDFSVYDYIFVIYAGGTPSDGSADDDHIWPHASSMNALTLDGKVFRSYSMSAELMRDQTSSTAHNTLSGIGTFCHELSHIVGLRDCYDTDYEQSGGTSDGLWGSTSIMDSGNYNNNSHTPAGYNAVDYWYLGLGTSAGVKAGLNELSPMASSHSYLTMETDVQDELYLFECRDNSSWDRYVGGKGMLVYHVDKTQRAAGFSYRYGTDLTASRRWTLNEVNCRPDHQCAYIKSASKMTSGGEDISGLFFGQKAGALDASELSSWSGTEGAFSLGSILRSSDGSVSFSAVESGAEIPIEITGVEAFQDAAIVSWSSPDCTLEMTLSCGGDTVLVAPYSPGLYSYTLEGLSPASSYNFTVSCLRSRADYSFTTRNCYPDAQSYIYVGSVEKTISGYVKAGSKVPLRVFNVPGSTVDWYWDGKAVSVGADGWFTLSSGGTLRAVVSRSDGTTDVITKIFCVK